MGLPPSSRLGFFLSEEGFLFFGFRFGFLSCTPPFWEANEQFLLGGLHFRRRGMVALGPRLALQILDSDVRLEVSGHTRQLSQDFPGRRLPTIDGFLFALGIDHQFWYAARPMKIQIWVEVLLVEGFDSRCLRRRNMGVSHVLSHHGSVLGLH